MAQITVVDFFSGCGGLSVGFHQHGFQIIAGVDNNRDALNTFVHNFPDAQMRLCDLANRKDRDFLVHAYKGKVTVAVGGSSRLFASAKTHPDMSRCPYV